jgi:hypothetical protein
VYSFNSEIDFQKTTNSLTDELIDSVGTSNLLYQGVFKEYPTYIAIGENFEMFTLNIDYPTSLAPTKMLDNDNIYVFVKDVNTQKWSEYKELNSLYLSDNISKVFEKRLNEYGHYEIKFGDNINGKKLNSGDSVSIFYLESDSSQGMVGVGATQDFVREVAAIAGIDPTPALAPEASRLPWYSHSVDSTYLTGKRVFIFGDASHAMAAARIAKEEMGFDVVGLGTYSREFARPMRELAASLGIEALITDDYLEVEERVAELHPDLVLGTQMERHIAKRLGVPCSVISAPVHVQDFPARFAPQMGYEGANVIFDAWVQPLMMGLEEHLLNMFKEDFEFHPDAPASHLGAPTSAAETRSSEFSLTDAHNAGPLLGASPDSVAVLEESLVVVKEIEAPALNGQVSWASDAEKELGRIPFFVRGKARRNTENYARERGIAVISVETLYEAKAHLSR